MKYQVVWGFASTGSRVGVLDPIYDKPEEAEGRVLKESKANDNPACGYWIEAIEEDTDPCDNCGKAPSQIRFFSGYSPRLCDACLQQENERLDEMNA